MKNIKAFSLSEALIVLGLIGILALTMVSLNNTSLHRQKVALAKISQVDSAIQAWGKSISKSNETGLGAADAITSNADLENSIVDYFNNHNIEEIQNEAINTSTGENYGTGFIQVTLDNGVVLNMKFLDNPAQLNVGGDTGNLSDPLLAVIVATVKEGNVTLSEEYVLKSSGIEDLASQFEGWAKYKVKPMYDDEGNVIGKGYCKSDACKGETACTAANGCISVSNPNTTGDGDDESTEFMGAYIYETTVSSQPCGSGYNGRLDIIKVGSVNGVYEREDGVCCPKPQIQNPDNINECICPGEDAMVIEPGYGYVDNVDVGCKVKCEAGQYSKDKSCVLCEINHQCPSVGMSESLDCQAGYICPKDTDIKNDDRYHEDKFDEETGNSIAEGGLIKQQICPQGTYQPNTNAEKCLPCPAGHYCPTDGTIKPTPCSAGTYYDPSQDPTLSTDAVCVKCPQNTFNPNEAYVPKDPVTTCPACPSGTWTNDIGATVCTVCPAGQYYSKKEQKCKPCPKGYYCPTSGLDGEPGKPNGPIPCECGMYQNQEGQTQCLVVPIGTYPTDGTKPSNAQTPVAAKHILSLAATTAELCPKGYMCPGGCPNTNGGGDGTSAEGGSGAVRKCLPGYFQSENGKFKCDPCSCGTYQPNEAAISCLTVAPGRYPAKGKVYADKAATNNPTCDAGTYCTGGCHDKQPCTSGFSYAGWASCHSCPYVSGGAYHCKAYVSVGGYMTANSNHTGCNCPNPKPYSQTNSSNCETTYSIPISGQVTDSAGGTVYFNSCSGIGGYYDPVILDLKNNGIKLTSPENGVKFDMRGDGNPVQTSWTDVQSEFDDAFLCRDKNNNGKIDNVYELFGDTEGSKTGLDSLAKLDSNKDGIINKDDEKFSELLLWADLNKDGITDEGELKSLAELNITEISTKYSTELDEDGNIVKDEHENQVGITSWFKQVFEEVVDGVTTLVEKIGKIIDVFFAAK